LLTITVAPVAVALNLVFACGGGALPGSDLRTDAPDHFDRSAVLGLAGRRGLVFVLLFGAQVISVRGCASTLSSDLCHAG